ncbi:MAG: ribbon-helix-helix protein, CopG family [Luteitalea sp.]|nr:ribbon-helix-helix protein, CopG family [Luteitalea sp.]
MAARPLQISIDTELLQRIDADPEARERGRSAFIRSAVQLYFKIKERREIEAQLTQAYVGEADAMLDEVGDLLSAQAWPES